MISKNYTITSLYSSAFLIISLLTAYFPLWLNKSLELDPKYIGYILSLSGFLKVLFILILATIIKTNNSLKNILLYLTLLTASLFFSVYIFNYYISVNFKLIITLLFLILFSPILPLIETLYSSIPKSSLNHYGKIRIFGSISFCLGVLFFGYLINIFSIDLFPLFLFLSLLFMSASILTIPNKLDVTSYDKIKNFKSLFKDRELLTYLIICSFIQGTHAMYYGYSTIIWERKGFSYLDIGKLWTFAIISEIFVFYYAGYFFKSKFLYNSLIFISLIVFLRWMLTYLIDEFYYLAIIQTLHGITFALTHFIMIYFINLKVASSLRLMAQTTYFSLTSGLVITSLTIICGHILSYSSQALGFIVMSMIGLLSFTFLFLKRKYYAQK
ncbi:MAG: MFS transporter [Pseudomonadota bacterium]|nr:MFS transporter [Pseudomonadota bacterium]